MERKFENSPITTTSTFAAISKIRGFTIDLLFLLKNHELRAVDLADLTGKYGGYVRRYLYNMRKYGLVVKNGSFWKLTSQGRSFLSYLESLNNSNKIGRKKSERRANEKRKKSESYIQKRPKQLSIRLWLQKSYRTFDDAEKEVVEVLLDHYNKTGSKFIFITPPDIFAIAERFNITPEQAEHVLRSLYQDRIVYHRHDRQHNAIKIGLYKAFIEKLELVTKIESTIHT